MSRLRRFMYADNFWQIWNEEVNFCTDIFGLDKSPLWSVLLDNNKMSRANLLLTLPQPVK
jgi:hypothetical protein